MIAQQLQRPLLVKLRMLGKAVAQPSWGDSKEGQCRGRACL